MNFFALVIISETRVGRNLICPVSYIEDINFVVVAVFVLVWGGGSGSGHLGLLISLREDLEDFNGESHGDLWTSTGLRIDSHRF